MGNKSTKSSLKNAIVILSISADPIQANDNKFWEQIWTEEVSKAAEIIKSIRTQEIRMLRDGSPRNFATLSYKMIERLHLATGTLCNTPSQQTAVINATRILIRILPCIFEDRAWRNFFIDNHIETKESESISSVTLTYPNKSDTERDYTSYLPREHLAGKNLVASRNSLSASSSNVNESPNQEDGAGERASRIGGEQPGTPGDDSLLSVLISSICDLLFCPEFTVPPHSHNYLSNSVDGPPEDLRSLVTCDYVWEPGVGYDSNINSTTCHDKSRSVILRLLLTCLGETLYETVSSCAVHRNHWIETFVSRHNRHALPLFTSLLNTIFNYNPTRSLLFNQFFYEDTRGELVELSAQILIAVLDYSNENHSQSNELNENDNMFIEYMSRIHRSEDFSFIIKGMTRLLSNRLEQGYLLHTVKYINFEQELLILNWKLCNLNRKYISHLLKTRDILDIVVPILYHLNENFQDSSKSALIHISVFNLLILSGERNFGVRLNKPYLANVLIDLPAFTGSHADLIVIVFHKLILYGHSLNQLFDFLLTIIVNVSPYLKTLSMMASNCLIQLFEIFSSSSVVLTEPNYHQLVVFLLEIFNNLIQYQFDGNANLIYAIINRKEIFSNLANMPTSQASIQRVLTRLAKIKQEHLARLDVSPNDQENVSDSLKDASRNSNKTMGEPTDSRTDSFSRGGGGGISLLATPGIGDVTHQTNPLELENERPNSDQLRQRQSPKEEKNHLSVDDILNQSSGEDPRFSQDRPMISMNDDGDEPSSTHDCLDPLIEVDKSDGRNSSRKQSTAMSSDISGSLDFNMEASCSGTSGDQSSNTVSSKREAHVWRPTPEWLKEWKQSLPLHTMIRMIEVLTPQIDRLVADNSGQRDELEIIKFLQNGTLVGLLPVPHPILIRKYHTNKGTTVWFRVCTWGVIYFRNWIWSDTEVKLIKLVK